MSEQVKSPVSEQEVAIQQLNLSYNAEQDRLLFRVGLSDNTELVIWLTHRIAKQMWALLNGDTQQATSNTNQTGALPEQAVQQFNQEAQAAEVLKKMDFSTKYQPRKEVRNDGAMLATEIRLTEDRIKHLDITCFEGVSVRMNLNQELILAICNMLQLATKEAEWDIGAALSLPALAGSNKQKVLH